MAATGIYGLSGSGLDIESLVKMGMMSKQSQYNKMQQQETINTWKKEEWSDIYSKLNEFNMNTLTTYKLQSNMSAMQAVSSNNGVVTATANGAAASMTHQVSVTQMASNAYMMTGDGWTITRESGNATSSDLSDVIFKSYKSLGGDQYEVSFSDGTKKTVKSDDTAISIDIADSINSDGTYNTKTLSYTYADLFDSKKTLNDLAAGIAKSGSNIQGGYDAANDSFSLYNKDGGKNNIIGLTAANKETEILLNNLHLAALDKATNSLGKYDTAGNFTSGVDASGKGQVYTFKSEESMPTKLETDGIVRSATNPTTLKDVLGLSATLAENSDGTYTITMKDSSNNEYTATGSIDDIKSASAFGIKVNNGTAKGDVAFTYGDLFDLEKVNAGGKPQTGNMSGKAELSDLASKVTSAVDSNGDSLGISAMYNAAKDSFSMLNLSGPTAALESDDAIGTQLVAALNLGTNPNTASKKADISATNLADVLGLSAEIKQIGTAYTYEYRLMQKGTSAPVYSITTGTAPFTDGTVANKTVFSFSIGDGDKTANIDITNGDLLGFGFESNRFGALLKPNTTSQVARTGFTDFSKNDFGFLADKINAAANDAGLGIIAQYDSTNGLVLNNVTSSTISITNVDGDAAGWGSKLLGALNLIDSPSASNIGMVGSNGITRVKATSTDSSLKDVLGISASKNSDGTLTVTDSEGKKSTVSADDKAFEITVGDTNNKSAISFTYAELFDTSGSGALRGIAGLDTLQQKINAAGLDAKASYDAANDKFTISNAAGHATIEGNDALGKKLVSNLGFKESSDTSSLKTGVVKGTDAEVTIDGKRYTLDKNSYTVAGVNYTFNDVTEPGKTANVTVSQNTDKIVDYVKQFVDDYNKLLDYFNDKLSEQRYADYKPLSSKQEEQMTESQISKWNEKAKSGLLYHDSTLQGIVNNMRDALFTPVVAADGKYNSAGSIGISSVTIKGHIMLDEEALRKALAEEPNSVYQIFASDQDSSYVAGSTNKKPITSAQKKLDYSNTGIANRLTSVMRDGLSTISDHAGTSKDVNDQSYLGKLITNLQTKMSTFKTQMSAYESMLYKRYDAMEVALQSFGTQLNYITGYGS